ncbi:hypothetical protein F3Y22_tig00013960pilonHSYRG00071 [Hibiscus syriacus]|uniref:Uncharacterized protein n=1 Tax=Hibiscus syriacus TaxID=106335 RepID=A0A6A3C0G0_HIBSY|nr:uncharacterized protein LOC120206655 [Hibiscus syriacus]KAE8722446.1 hypothetical protein F3Y22_tig00013960pilonHSYRG00071 [Hibiscus syriacus]
MALTLTISNGSCSYSTGNGVRILRPNHLPAALSRRRRLLLPTSPRTFHLTSAAKKFRTGRYDSKNRRSNLTTKEQDDELERKRKDGNEEENDGIVGIGLDNVGLGGSSSAVSTDGKPFPDLPGLQPDPFEGPQWDVLGFLVQYLWAFGIVFALIACGIAVATYNEGATDFKETPAYKESIQSQELLEQPDASSSDVFESNPTEVAPSLE